VQALLDSTPPAGPVSARSLPGPTGESNRLTAHPRDPILCLGPGATATDAQIWAVTALGGRAAACPGTLAAEALTRLTGLSAVLYWGPEPQARAIAQALAQRSGPILPLIGAMPDRAHVTHERHICIDTTASGGNAALLAGAGTA